MRRILITRVLQGVLVLWGISTTVFFLVRVIGDPARLILPETATAEQIDALREQLGLLDPLPEQYIRFLSGALRGDFGESAWTRRPVLDMVFDALPNTLLLAVVTIIIALVVSTLLGVRAGAKPDSVATRVTTVLSFISISLPDFWFALVLISVFAVSLGVLPTSGFGGGKYLVLPVLTLLARPVGRLAQTTRRMTMETLQQDFIVTAESKGLSRSRILLRHALPNSLLGIITLAGDEMAQLVAGIVVVETIFAWPGLGQLSLQAIERRDPFLLVGIVVATAGLILILNLIIDLLYAAIDPRIRARWVGV